MKKIIIKLGILVAVFFPVLAFAQQKDLRYLVFLTVQYFNYALYLIMGLAVLMFVWNVFKYFIKGGDDVTAKKEANLYVMWSLIGFFVILSIWGLVRILTNTFRLDNQIPYGFFGNFYSPFNTGGSGGTPLPGGPIGGGTKLPGGPIGGGTKLPGGPIGGGTALPGGKIK